MQAQFIFTGQTFQNGSRASSHDIKPGNATGRIKGIASLPSFGYAHAYDILTENAREEMAAGTIPDLSKVCYELYRTFFSKQATGNALQFVPVLKGFEGLDPESTKRFIMNPQTNHVLVQNELLKVVLIHWKPGKHSSIHGHAKGGCVFKVLRGNVIEKRYTPDPEQQLLSATTCGAGSIAYIDDEMAHHAVGNPFGMSCISLHAYTPGI